MRLAFVLPALLIASMWACQKPANVRQVRNTGSVEASVPPLIISTRLKDSLPVKALEKLGLEKVSGTKIKFNNGRCSSYFSYQANPENILDLIATSPFDLYAPVADTACRAITYRDFDILKKHLGPEELSHPFWQKNSSEYNFFECIKPPFKHTLAISKNATQIFHRVESLI